MAQYSNFIRTNLENGWVICEDVHLPSRAVSKIFIGPCGIYVLSSGCCDPKTHFQELQDILGSTKIRLFLTYEEDCLFGLYEPEQDMLYDQMTDDTLIEDVNSWLTEVPIIFDEDAIERIVGKIQSADIKARGYYVDEDGNLHVLRHGKLFKASQRSSDSLYYLTLFTGTLGFQRFALGKIFSGLIYFFTGGFFLVGWLTDLLQIFLGIMKDRRKRYILPLSNTKMKLLILPLGLMVGFFLFFVYRYLSNAISDLLNSFIAYEVTNADPQEFESLADLLMNGFTD